MQLLHSVHRCARWAAACSILAVTSAIATVASPSAASSTRSATTASTQATTRSLVSDENGDGHYCDGCTPPLVYLGGRVMDTTQDAGLTITPIYWEPADGRVTFPDGYERIINEYVANVAADSDSTSNVYSVDSEYYQDIGGTKTPIRYHFTAGTPIVDTAPFPASGCPLASSDYTACITDAQIRTELTRVATEQGLTTDLANFYPLFLPPGIETADADGSNSDSSFCGYHSEFGSGTSEIVYGNEPFKIDGCDSGQSPNGNPAADASISTLSHEVNEAVTDPGDDRAWNDSSGYEIGDICGDDYGPALGSTDPSNPTTTEYNQVINGGRYYTQTEFSNLAFASFGKGGGCVQSEGATGAPPANDPTSVDSVFSYAFPNMVPADGTSTSSIQAEVTDVAGDNVPDDPIKFSVYAISGTGQCGSLSASSASADSSGFAEVTYTASTDDVTCAIVSTDAKGGQSSTGTVYQGTAQADAPTSDQTFPSTLEPGAEATTFTTSFTNPGAKPIVDAEIDFVIFPADDATTNVTASQVSLSYSTTGADGPFTPVDLSGSTVADGEIQGVIGAEAGTTVDATSTVTVTYKMSLDASVSPDTSGELMDVEVYLNQINLASGAGTNLADTTAYPISVTAGSGAPPGTASADSTGDTADTASSDSPGTSTNDTSTNDTSTSDTEAVTTDAPTAAPVATAAVPTTSPNPTSSSGSGVVIALVAALIVIAGLAIGFVVRKRRARLASSPRPPAPG